MTSEFHSEFRFSLKIIKTENMICRPSYFNCFFYEFRKHWKFYIDQSVVTFARAFPCLIRSVLTLLTFVMFNIVLLNHEILLIYQPRWRISLRPHSFNGKVEIFRNPLFQAWTFWLLTLNLMNIIYQEST